MYAWDGMEFPEVFIRYIDWRAGRRLKSSVRDAARKDVGVPSSGRNQWYHWRLAFRAWTICSAVLFMTIALCFFKTLETLCNGLSGLACVANVCG